MTTQEFSNAFDTLLNSYGAQAKFGEEESKQAIVFDEYEKSLFLTQAQEDVVLSLYTGKNSYRESFESTEEQRRYLSNIIEEKAIEPNTDEDNRNLGLSSHSFFFTLPQDLWFITYESVTVDKINCGSTVIMKVFPTKQDEYQNIEGNPFRGANNRRALRLDLSNGNVEIVCKYPVSRYYVRYIRKPRPIILTDLPDELSIATKSKTTECELHEVLHQKILEAAVLRALQSKGYNINKDNRDN